VRRDEPRDSGDSERDEEDRFHADSCVSHWRAVIHRAILDANGICSHNIGHSRDEVATNRERIKREAIDYLRHDSIEHDAVKAGLEVSTIWALYRGCGEILREKHTTPQRVGAILRRVMARVP